MYCEAGILLLLTLAFASPLWAIRISGSHRLDPIFDRAVGRRLVGSDAPSSSRKPRLLLPAVAFVLPIAVVIVLVGAVGDAHISVDLCGVALSLYLTGFAAGSAAVLVVDRARRPSVAGLPRWTAIFTFTSVGIVMLGMFIATAGTEVYPHIPRQFGGGQATTLRLVFAGDGRAQARALGLLEHPKDYVSPDVRLLFEGDTSLVLRRSDGQVVEVRKDVIRGSAPSSSP